MTINNNSCLGGFYKFCIYVASPSGRFTTVADCHGTAPDGLYRIMKGLTSLRCLMTSYWEVPYSSMKPASCWGVKVMVTGLREWGEE